MMLLKTKYEPQLGDHPSLLIKAIAGQCLISDESYRFKIYDSVAQEVVNELVVTGAALCDSFSIDNAAAKLEYGRVLDAAFTSELSCSGRHIPLVDFACPSLADVDLAPLARALADMELACMHIYRSTRSYHGYVPALLEERAWVAFMGRMLHVNPFVGGVKVVDDRWIGHKLIAGAAHLRWTANGAKYEGKQPAYVTTVYASKLGGIPPKKEDGYAF